MTSAPQSFPTADLNHTVSITVAVLRLEMSHGISDAHDILRHIATSTVGIPSSRLALAYHRTPSEVPVIFGLGLTFVVSAASSRYQHHTLFSTLVASTEDRIRYEDTLLGPVPFEKCGRPSGPHFKGQMFFWLQRSSTPAISSSSRLLCGTFLPLSDFKVTVAPSMRQWLALLTAVQFERVGESYRLRFLSSAPSKPNSLV